MSLLDAEAIASMERGDFAEAVGFWELLFSAGAPRLAQVLLYALCLARVGRPDDARDTCTAVRLDLDTVPEGLERQAVGELLRTVTLELGHAVERPSVAAGSIFDER